MSVGRMTNQPPRPRTRRSVAGGPGSGPSTIDGVPLNRRWTPRIDDGGVNSLAFQLKPAQHAPKKRVELVHEGAPTRGTLTMGAPNFSQRRDRGWRRGWPFRFYMITGGDVPYARDYPGVGNKTVAMTRPRMLQGLLPSQTSTWQPYQYPTN
jgi:hypothetical protein